MTPEQAQVAAAYLASDDPLEQSGFSGGRLRGGSLVVSRYRDRRIGTPRRLDVALREELLDYGFRAGTVVTGMDLDGRGRDCGRGVERPEPGIGLILGRGGWTLGGNSEARSP